MSLKDFMGQKINDPSTYTGRGTTREFGGGLGTPYGKPVDPSSQLSQQIQGVIAAVAQGQDISQFDPQVISAAKQQVVMQANQLSRLVNSSSLPPNVTREQLRDDIAMYEGFANKLAEDDPTFANLMDVALIGAGVYAGAKYGPMAAAKAKVGLAKGAGMAFGFGSRGMDFARQTASQGAEYFTSPEFRQSAANIRSNVGDMGRSTYGFGKKATTGISKALRRALRIPV